jgi:uncharacterized membrane protein YedE/YeeE
VPSWIYGMLVPVLVLLFAGQALFHFRDAIAAHWPKSKPVLITLCAAAGCQVRALQDVTALSIEASDLQADPAHKGLLILSATIRNRAPFPLAYPYIELTLSDTQEQPVVRRAFAPGEYISGVLLGSLFFASFNMGFTTGIKAFVAATLGGLGSVPGAMVGGLLFGLIETFSGTLISTSYKDAVGMIVLILILLFAVAPIVWLTQAIHRRRRLRHGMCLF